MIRHLKYIKWSLLAFDTVVYWASVIFIGRENFFSFSIRGVSAYGFIYLVLILGLYSFKSYDQVTLTNGKKESAIRTASAVLISGVFAVGMVVLFLPFYELRPWRFIKAMGTCMIIMPLLRTATVLYIKRVFPSKRCIVIGDKAKWHCLMIEMSNSLSRKFLPVAYCQANVEKLENCLEKRSSATSVVITEESTLDDKRIMDTLKKSDIEIHYLPHLVEKVLKRIPMKVLESYQSYYSICFQDISSKPIERSFNLAAAAILSVILAPFAAAAAIAIATDDGKPMLFRQKRTGKGGEHFTIYKFRTMSQADEKCHGDPDQDLSRLTKAGRIIRKLRLDEIPQLINIIRGDMNLVGPRPEIDRFVKMCSGSIPFYEDRHRIKPGITGWAQIKYRYTSDLETYKSKTEYDLYYVKNQNILLDLTIILATVGTMVGMKGAK